MSMEWALKDEEVKLPAKPAVGTPNLTGRLGEPPGGSDLEAKANSVKDGVSEGREKGGSQPWRLAGREGSLEPRSGGLMF